MTGITDENSSRYATFKYDTAGRAISSEHAGGVGKVTLTYGSGSTQVTDALNTSRTHTFQTILGVARHASSDQPCTSGCGAASASTTYDSNGNVASETDFNGNTTCSSFDLARNLETTRVEGFAPGISCPTNLSTYAPTAGTLQRKTTTQWHASYNTLTLITEPNRATSFTYDAQGNVLTKTVFDTVTSISRTWTYTYNSFGQMLSTEGPRTDVSDITTYTYYNCTTGYQCGQLQTVESGQLI